MGTSVTDPGSSAGSLPDGFESSLDSAISSAATDAGEVETPDSSEADSIEDFRTEAETPDSDVTGDGPDEGQPDVETAPEEPVIEDADAVDPDEPIAGTHRGQKGFFLTEKRWQTREDAFKTLREAGTIMSDEPTIENIKERNRAYRDEQKMYADYLCANGGVDEKTGLPTGQLSFIKHFADEAARAQEAGESPSDAFVSLCGSLPTVAGKYSPEARTEIIKSSVRELLTDLYPVAKALINPAVQYSDALFNSLQRVENEVFQNYTKLADVQIPNPKQQAQQNAERSAAEQLAQLQKERKEESWNRFVFTANNAITRDAIDGVITEALKPFEKAKPEKLAETKALLKTKIEAGFKAYAELRQAINSEMHAAELATSEQVRNKHMQNLVRLHSFSARRTVSEYAPQMSKELTGQIKAQIDARHQKREAASQHRTPGGTGKPVTRSLLPASTGDTHQDWAAFVNSV